MSKRVLIPIANGTEELEAVTIIDILRRADLDVVVASVQEKEIVTARKVRIVADRLIADCVDEEWDLIALPGGMPGALNLYESKELQELLIQQKERRRYYAAICAAPAVVLKPLGLLDGLHATCYPTFAEKIGENYIGDRKVVIDDCCITSKGPGTAIRFGLKLVELLCGHEKRQELTLAMIVN